MTTPAETHTAFFDTQQLHGLLQASGVQLRDRSPFLEFLRQGERSSGQAAPLAGHPRFEEWRRAATILADSDPALIIDTFFLDRIERHFFLVPPEQEKEPNGLLASQAESARLRLSHPFGKRDLFTLLAEALRPTDCAPPIAVDLGMSLEELVAFAAIVDQIRLLYAASLIQREGFASITFALTALEDQLTKASAQQDYRWLAAQCASLFPEIGDFAEGDLRLGVAELRKRGFLVSRRLDGQLYIQPSPELVDISFNLFNPLPCLCIHSPPELGGQQPYDRRLIAIRGTSMWLIRENGGDADGRQVRLSSVDGLTALQALYEHLNLNSRDAAQSGHGTARIPNSRPKAGSRLADSPTGEGAPSVSEGKTRCIACNAVLDTRKKFCTRCGAAQGKR